MSLPNTDDAPGLGLFPRLTLDVVADTTAQSRCDEGFVRVRRRRLVVTYADGTRSAPFAYDEAWREALDAVAIVAHYRDAKGERRVFLRSAFRPPAALRAPEIWPIPEKPTLGHLWELPAGLVEPDERSEAGLRRGAARELHEELGFEVEPSKLIPLGASMFPSPGMTGERIFFFQVDVDPAARSTPTEDGSALEKGAHIIDVSLARALSALSEGEIEDMKTEIGLRRLAELG